ncbi:cupin domain-containing protein [Streptomyces sp. H27-D2]|uniref:cupin domain-containing protein n=1 Tax=Streptomyces sp. H27-D2 TaxID=3046304 RepID=UPI002DB8012E|nr:cupin domain-containing protein [Streptomyces sp. H27-D2]MEC4016325.1 cupin domain-containing protein [Streptomyces sp. H27-D2]
MSQTARSDVSIDNDQVRVTTWTFQPGEQTGGHRHELPYIVVPLTAGRMRIESGDDSTLSTLAPGSSYFREAGAAHNVTNDGQQELIFTEIELKATPRSG